MTKWVTETALFKIWCREYDEGFRRQTLTTFIYKKCGGSNREPTKQKCEWVVDWH